MSNKESYMATYALSIIAVVFSSLAVIFCIGLSNLDLIIKVAAIMIFAVGTNILFSYIFRIFKLNKK